MVSADELRDIMYGVGDAKLRERRELEQKQKLAEKALHEEFLKRELAPDLMKRLSVMVSSAAQRGEKEILVFRFPSKFCTDRGRAINNADPNWPETLEGAAKRVFEFFQSELKPRGFKLRAEIVEFPGGMPGDVGFRLAWA
jgi:hypothetical protein